jgi:hypothetical protein
MNIVRFLFILLLSALPYNHLRGQTRNTVELKGEVVDSLNRRPLAYVHVKIKNSPTGVPTNSEGKFSLPITSELAADTLVVSLIGYTTKWVPVKEVLAKGFYTFLLTENTLVLEEVVVETESAENIIKEVARRLKQTFPAQPFEFEGYYRNAYKELDTYVRQVEVAFQGFDGNFHQRNGHSVSILKKRESPDYRQFQWRQAQGNLPWHNLWRFRRQHHYFFSNKEYRHYHYSLEDITYLEGEKVYKLKFVLKDNSIKNTESWAYVRAKDYAILGIGGKTAFVNPQKFKLADSLFMSHTSSHVLVKYTMYKGRMYPAYSSSNYTHEVYNGQSVRQGIFEMNEELIIHQISTPANYASKNSFEQSQQEKRAALPADSLFWQQYTRPVETLLSKAIENDLANKGKAYFVRTNTPSDTHTLAWMAVDKLQEDFTLFRSSLQEAHPSLYRYTQKKELDSLFEATYQSLTHPLSEIAFYKLLTPIIAKIRCGHTGSLPSQRYGELYFAKNPHLPIQTEYIDGKLYQIQSYDTTAKAAEGHELISINGLPIEEIIQRIIPHIAADGYITSAKYKELGWNFTKLYSLYIGHAQRFEVVSRSRKGDVATVSLPAISYDTYTNWRSKRNQQNAYTLLDTKTALLKIATFSGTHTQPFETWIEDAFRDIRQKKIANLIIDLRGNEGGRDDDALYLLSFLAKTPFRYHQSLQAATHRFSFLSYSDQPESFNA